MPQVKTAVSIDAELFDAAEHLAKVLQLTRSGLYARALAEFIERHRSRELLEKLNAASSGSPDEEALLRSVRRTMRCVGDPTATEPACSSLTT